MPTIQECWQELLPFPAGSQGSTRQERLRKSCGLVAQLAQGLPVLSGLVWLRADRKSSQPVSRAGCGHGAAGDGLGAWEGRGCLQTPVPCSDWAFQGAWLPLPTLQAWDPQFPVPAGSWPMEAPDVGSCW